MRNAKTKPCYRMFHIEGADGGYPALVDSPSGECYSVDGEIYEVSFSKLSELDSIEGVPWLYQRKQIELEGAEENVLAYIYQQDVTGRQEILGCWRAFKKEN